MLFSVVDQGGLVEPTKLKKKMKLNIPTWSQNAENPISMDLNSLKDFPGGDFPRHPTVDHLQTFISQTSFSKILYPPQILLVLYVLL